MDYFSYLAYVPPDDPPPPDKEGLTEALKTAIQNGDIDKARWVFDTAFWNKIEIIPDWRHLLAAVALKDRQMVKLLAAHGASWTEEETRCLKDIFFQQWPEFAATLHSAGMQASPGGPTQPSDVYTAVSLRLHILTAVKDRLSPEIWAQKKLDVDGMIAQGVIDCLDKEQTKKAVALLRLRHPEGAVDFEREFKKLIRVRNHDAALNALDRLRHAGLDITPLTLDLGISLFFPEAVAPLDQRGLLAARQPYRMSVISGLVGKMDYSLHHKAAISILFGWGSAALTESEADSFITNYQAAIKKNLTAIDRVCDHLKALGFFDSSVWTMERLRTLNAQAPEHSSLKQIFNKKLADGRFGKMLARDILSPENLASFIEAHRKGYYQANANQASDLLVTLQGKYADGRVPQECKDMLRSLKECGVHFSNQLYTPFYLGKQAPGMAKVLLALDILKPSDLHLADLRERAELPNGKDWLYWTKNSGEYAEFFFQIALEQKYPEEFVPQRGKIPSYHEAFKAKFFEEAPPKPQPKMRNKWFW